MDGRGREGGKQLLLSDVMCGATKSHLVPVTRMSWAPLNIKSVRSLSKTPPYISLPGWPRDIVALSLPGTPSICLISFFHSTDHF